MAQLKQVQGHEKAKSAAVMRTELRVHSLPAQKVMTRSFTKLGESLFQIGVILRAVGNKEQIDEAEELIVSRMKQAQEDIANRIAQSKELMEQNGISAAPSYTNPVVYEIELSTPHLARFSGLVQQLDELVALIDTLWFNAVLDDRQASNAKFEARQRLIRLAGRIIGMARQVRQKAYSSGQKETVDEVAPQGDDSDMDEELAKEADQAAKSDESVA